MEWPILYQLNLANLTKRQWIFFLYFTLATLNFRRGMCNAALSGEGSFPGTDSQSLVIKRQLDDEQMKGLVDSFRFGKVESLKYSHLGTTLEKSGLSVEALEKLSEKVHFPESSGCDDARSRTKRSMPADDDLTEDDGESEMDKVAFDWGKAVLGGLFAVHRPDTDTGEPCQELYNVAALWVESMIYAVKKINEDPEILPGIKLGYEVRDDCSDSNKVLQAGLQFVDSMSANGSCDESSKTVGVVGTGSSRTSDIVAKLFALFELPQVSYSATSPFFSNKQDYPYFLRTVGSDAYQARVLADLAEMHRWNYVALIYSDDQYGSPGQEALNQLFSDMGVCAVVTRKVSVEMTDGEIESIIDQIKADPKIEVIFTFTSKSDIKRVLTAANKKDLTGLTWIATDSWGDSQDTIQGHEDVVKGMLGVSPRAVIDEDFKTYLKTIDPYTYTDNPWYRESLEAYGCVFNGTAEEGIPCDHSEPFLAQLDSPSEGRATSLVIDAVYALTHGLHDMLQTYDDPENCFDHFHGSEYLDFVKNVTFPGLTSNPFAFDKNGDPYSEYSIFNLQNTSNVMTFKDVGFWKFGSHLNLSADAIIWGTEHGGPSASRCSEDCQPGSFVVSMGSVTCCWTCTPCPVDSVSAALNSGKCFSCEGPLYANSNQTECLTRTPAAQGWDKPSNVVILVFALIGLLGTAFCFVVYVCFRNTPVVKATSMELSLVCLLGIALTLGSAILYAAEPSNVTCQAQTFVISIGFSTLIGALLMKTNRISQIFNRKLSDGRPSMLLQIKYQILFVFLLVLAQMTLCIINLYLFPSVARDSYTIDTKTFKECQMEKEWISLVVTIGYNMILGMVCNYQAFRIRTLPGLFNDSRSIFFTIFTLMIVCFVIVVITMATVGDTKAFGMSLSVLFGGYSGLCLLFGSKMWVVIFKPKNNVPQPTFDKIYKTSSTLSPVASQDGSEIKEINGNAPGLTKPSCEDDSMSEEDDIFDSGNYSDISTVVGEDDEDIDGFLEEVARLEEELQCAKKERNASIQELQALKENARQLEETHGKDVERMRALCRKERQSVIEILAEVGLSDEEIQAKLDEVAAQKCRDSSKDTSDQTPQEKFDSFEAEWQKLNQSSENCLAGFQNMKDTMFPNGFEDVKENGSLGHQNRAFEPETLDTSIGPS